MKNLKTITTITLGNSEWVNKCKKIRLIGGATIITGLVITIAGEIMSNKCALNIHAMNNEAADMIEELSDIWYDQHKK